MKAKAYLRLGRVSNLPTIWTNVVAGAALGQGEGTFGSVAFVALPMSLAYVGGMFLNDAFDREIDRETRPERPIPSGQVSAREVFGVGFALLGAAILLVAGQQLLSRPQASFGAIAACVALAGLVVLYDVWHKENPFSPVVMGACRGAVYVTAALATGGTLNAALALGAASVLAYVVGLTFVARYESKARFGAWAALGLLAVPAGVALFHGGGSSLIAAAVLAFVAWTIYAVSPLLAGGGGVHVPRAVARLIAGICLVDGMMGAALGNGVFVAAALAGMGATMAAQRFIRGT